MSSLADAWSIGHRLPREKMRNKVLSIYCIVSYIFAIIRNLCRYLELCGCVEHRIVLSHARFRAIMSSVALLFTCAINYFALIAV